MILVLGIIISFIFLVQNSGVFTSVATLLFLILLVLGSKEKSIFNPYFLFAMTPFSLMIYNPTISEYFLLDIDGYAGSIIISGIVCFILGLWIIKPQPKRHKNVDRSFWLFMFLGAVPQVLGVLKAGVPLFAVGQEEVETIRANFEIPIISQFSIFLPLAIISAFKEKKLFKISIALIVGIFFAIITVSKFTILLTLMFIAFSVMKYGKRKKLSPSMKFALGFIALSFPLLFGLVHDKRSDLDQSEYEWRQQVASGVEIIETYGDIIYLPYLYATSPWSNFVYNVQQQEKYTYGKTSAKPIISLLQLDGYFPPDEKPIYQFPMNTHAFVTDFYKDFGIFGVVIFSMLLGIFVKYVYLKSLTSNDVLCDGLWVTFSFATFMLFFSNHFTTVGYPFIIYIIFAVYSLVSRSLKNSFKSNVYSQTQKNINL